MTVKLKYSVRCKYQGEYHTLDNVRSVIQLSVTILTVDMLRDVLFISVIILSIAMLTVVMPSVIMLSVVATVAAALNPKLIFQL